MIVEETYQFTLKTKKYILFTAIIGCILFAIGFLMSMNFDSHGDEHQALSHMSEKTIELNIPQESHHGSSIWLKRIYTSLWQNTLFFTGFGIIGLFFVTIQYAAQAGWSASIKRVPLAMGSWIPVSGVLMLVLWFVVKEDVFHWTHHDLYVEGNGYDAIMVGKEDYFFWPMEAGTFPFFYVARLVVFFVIWYLFFIWIKREILAEDIHGGESHWLKARSLSAGFLVVFAITSSIAAWDWVMSIDAHWFSTMLGWYVFSSWWVSGLSMIALIVVLLKDKGYLKIVNANHLHDLGKFIFAFSIFWCYIWFSQFLLIYYANIPEEAVYFITRLNNAPYNWIFYLNIILNFVLPFLLLMTRNAKRQTSMIKIVCTIVLIGHWFDFYNMITPGVMQYNGELGLIEIGLALIYLAAFLFVTLGALSKAPLIPKKHPMLEESIHHHT